MTHHTDAERAEFEAAIRATMHDAGEDHIAERLERWPDGAYKDRATGYAWWGYQKAARRAPAAPVPQGWKLVPNDANMTDEQAEAICAVAKVCGGGAYDIYRAALAAAPQPPDGLMRENSATKQEAAHVHSAIDKLQWIVNCSISGVKDAVISGSQAAALAHCNLGNQMAQGFASVNTSMATHFGELKNQMLQQALDAERARATELRIELSEHKNASSHAQTQVLVQQLVNQGNA